jgi:drug/metabolite transporter (DMT)-like permease
MGNRLAGALLATMTAAAWGGQFVVGKSALGRVDAFNLTTVRYAIAALALVVLLVAFEGPRALRLDGRGLRLFWLGSLGFAGFNLLVYTGLTHSRPESASLLAAFAPLLTALVLWGKTGVRPGRRVLIPFAVALVGVTLVISRGDPISILRGSIGWGDVLVLGGVTSFVLYTLGAAEFAHFSPLRYTTLTAALGWLSVAGATGIAILAGLEPAPSAGAAWSIAPQIAYITFIGAVFAVVAWNGAVGRIGPQNTALFGNLIPVTTFAIEIVRGYRPGALEIVGAAITISALAAGNLLSRRPAPRVVEDATELEVAKAA